MPRVHPKQVAEAMSKDKPSRTPKQLANDARLRAKKGKTKGAPEIHVKKNMLGPDDVKDLPEFNISISPTGELETTRGGIEVVPEAKMKVKAEEARFMNEMIELQIEADDDPNAPLFVQTGHNGITQYIWRGKPQTVKRKFLYSLIAAKQGKLVCTFGKDGSGQEFNSLKGPARPTHRVTVLRDTDAGRAAYHDWMTTP